MKLLIIIYFDIKKEINSYLELITWQYFTMQGTLIALSSLSQGKLVDKMKSAALLSPIAYLSHITTRLGKLAARVFVADVCIEFVLR